MRSSPRPSQTGVGRSEQDDPIQPTKRNADVLGTPATSSGTWAVLGEEAHEILDISGVVSNPKDPVPTYKSGDSPDTPGDTEVPDELWESGYVPPPPFIRNTTRNLQFNEQIFIASPESPDGVTTYASTSDGYTWGAMSQAINAMWPYNAADYANSDIPLTRINAYYAGNFVTTPPPGVVKVTANYKAQDMKFWANQDGVAPGTAGAIALDRYIITDQWGNRYIMHASGQADQADVGTAFDAAVLPEGWSKTVIQLDDDLILNPAKGSDGKYHYLVFRDSADNTYHQIYWSGQGSLATQLEDMPIWGGQSDDVLSGDGDDDLIHGAGGNDVVSGGAGRDELWGDLGDDTLKGGTGRDKLYGNEGNDLLIGGSRNDVLNGGPGQDILNGGPGDDEFVFASITDSLVGAPDLIIDFKRGRDAINLAAIDANTTVDGDQAFVYIGRKAFSNTAGELRLNAGGTLIGDVDGNGQADFAIALLHGARLTSGDFIL